MNWTDIKLVGLPFSKISDGSDVLLSQLAQSNPDLIMIQMDPMPYITRQRYLSHKCALNGVEDYNVKSIENLNEPKPISFEESIVDLLILDMSIANQVHTKIDYTKGLLTYSYPSIQLKSTTDNLTDKFVSAITDYVIADKWSPYHEVSRILFQALMGKHKVMLGDMPEVLLRQILGNTLTIRQTRDIFKMVLSKIEDLANVKDPILTEKTIETESEKSSLMRRITLDMFSHIFLAPKDLYMTAILKEAAKPAISTVAFVGHPHFIPMTKYWTPPPHGINFSQATKIPDRLENETNEELIEKQVIFEMLLGTRLWAEKYVFNPFPYIESDITKIINLDELKKTFYINLKKYELFRNSVIDSFVVKQIEYSSVYKEQIATKERMRLTKL